MATHQHIMYEEHILKARKSRAAESGVFLFTNIDVTFLLIFKFANHETKELCTSKWKRAAPKLEIQPAHFGASK